MTTITNSPSILLQPSPQPAANQKADTSGLPTTAEDSLKNLSKYDWKNMSIAELISTVMLDRYAVLQEQVRQQADKVQAMNDQLRGLGLVKSGLAVYGTDVSKPDAKVDLNKPGATLADLKKLATDNNVTIDWSTVTHDKNGTPQMTQGNLAKLNQTIDTATTSATNMQSVEYNKLQDYAQKLTQALDLASNTSKKFADSQAGTISNMR